MTNNESQGTDTVEDYALVLVPNDEKLSLLSVFLVCSGILAVFAFIATGTAVGLRYDVAGLVEVAVVASLILVVIGSEIAYIGGLTHLSMYITTRYPFGYLGSWIWVIVGAGTLYLAVPKANAWFTI